MRTAKSTLVVVAALLPFCFTFPEAQEDVPSPDSQTETVAEDGQQQEQTGPPIPPEPELLTCYDYVVVGAGSAGSVVANRLSANKTYSVLLLEAGDEPTKNLYVPFFSFMSANESNSWQFYTVSQTNGCLSFPDRKAPMTQGKLLGGTSGINSMSYVRGHKADFDNWKENYSAEGWSYQDVLPFFKEIEVFNVTGIPKDDVYHGYQGETPINYPNYNTTLSYSFLNACKESGYEYIDYNGATSYGYSRLQSNTRDGVRMSAYTCFIQFQKYDRENRTLHVFSNSIVTKIVFDNSNTATAVEFTKNGEKKSVTIGREVILCAGAIGSPHLLMLSGIGPRDELTKANITVVAESPVGIGLQDHVVFLGLVVTTNEDYIGLEKLVNNESMFEYGFNHSGLWAVPGAYEALLFTNSTKETKSPDIKLSLTALFPSPAIEESPYVTPELYREFYLPLIMENKTGFMNTITMGQPNSRGTVKLNKTDPSGPPLIDPNILSDKSDIDRTVQGILKVKELFKTPSMVSIGAKVYEGKHPNCSHTTPWTKEYVQCFLQYSGFPSMHVCCTCPMGKNNSTVVDERLRVRGVQRVRVADASVMPHITSGNTHAPVMMIGAKAAHMILEDALIENEKWMKKRKNL